MILVLAIRIINASLCCCSVITYAVSGTMSTALARMEAAGLHPQMLFARAMTHPRRCGGCRNSKLNRVHRQQNYERNKV